jgi:hypothetical protein
MAVYRGGPRKPGRIREISDLLVPGNRVWAPNAAAFVVVASRTRFEYNDRPSITHGFDAGAARKNLTIEVSRRQLAAHGVEGFDYARAKVELSIRDSTRHC